MNVKRIVPSEEELMTLPSAFYRCPVCNLRVKTKSNLRAHLIKTHKVVEDEKDTAFLTKKKTDFIYTYHCPVSSCKHGPESGCGFARYNRLKQHYQLVHMKKSFKCTCCDQRFSTPTAQAYHSKTCGTLYECPVCGRKYRQKKFLIQHTRRSGHRVNSTTPQNKIDTYRADSESSGKANTLTGNEQPTTSLIKPIILPILVLPLGVSADKISSMDITSAFAEAFAQIRCSIATSVSLASVSFASSVASSNGVLRTSNEPRNIKNEFSTKSSSSSGILSESVQTTLPSTNAVCQQTSPNIHDYSLVPLVDVSTATLRLACAQTQTKPLMPVSIKTGTEEDDLSDLFFDMTDCCTETSEKSVPFAQSTSQPSSFMSSVNTFELPGRESSSSIYPPFSNASQFMRSCRQIDDSSDFLSSAFQQSGATTNTLFPVGAQSCSGISSLHLCEPIDGNPPLLRDSTRLLNLSNSSQSDFRLGQPSSLCQQFHWSEGGDNSLMQIAQNTPLQALGCCMSTQCEYMSENYLDSNRRSISDRGSFSGQDQNQEDFHYTSNVSTWMPLLPQEDQSHVRQLHVGCTAKPSMLVPNNSVAVETTIDLMDFDLQNSGKCCWPPADSFSNMYTQTTGDAELDQWLNSVHTQTALHASSRDFMWPTSDSYSPADCTDGVKNDLLTPDPRTRYI